MTREKRPILCCSGKQNKDKLVEMTVTESAPITVTIVYGITLMAESEKELKSLLLKVKEESKKAGLKLNSKTNTML